MLKSGLTIVAIFVQEIGLLTFSSILWVSKFLRSLNSNYGVSVLNYLIGH